jgi:hypothetical protein
MSKRRSQTGTEALADAEWHVSSYSGSGNNCVEFGKLASRFQAVRDTKDREAGALIFTAHAWSFFVEFAKGQNF